MARVYNKYKTSLHIKVASVRVIFKKEKKINLDHNLITPGNFS